MATFSGNIASRVTYDGTGGQSTNITSTDDGFRVFDAWAPNEEPVEGSMTNNLPISMAPATLQGNRGLAGSGTVYWYDRFHVEPSVIEVGNIVTDTTSTFVVWNGWRGQKRLIEITDNGNTAGLGITESASLVPPYLFAGYEEKSYTLSVSIDGPSTVDAVYQFVTSSGESPELAVTGQRIFAWTFRPNWAGGVEERMEWMTDVLTAYDGTEQRLALRTNPRRTIAYQFMLDDGSDRRKFEALLFNWGARTWMMPVWMEGNVLTSDLVAGSSSVTVPRMDGNWAEGGYCMIYTSAFSYEIAKIQTIAGNTVTFNSPTDSTWSAGAVIYPAVTGLIDDQIKLSRFTGDTEHGSVAFRVTETETVAAPSETTYRDLPVITEPPHWHQDITHDFVRKLRDIDFRLGKFLVDDEAGMPFNVISHHWTADGKSEIDDLRKFIYARMGKQKAVWLPTFAPDLLCVDTIGASSIVIDVESAYITRHLWGHVNRRDIMIELVDGTKFYRRLNGVSELSSTVERITINASLGQQVEPEDIRRISWLSVARFDTDSISLVWKYDDWVDCSVNWRTVRDDV